MNREELLKHHQTLCSKAFALMQKKNADYAGRSGEEPFANFTRCEAMGICKTEAGMLVRMTDKMSRLSSFVESGTLQVKDESVEDTCLDLINYSVLFYSYLQGKKNENASAASGSGVSISNLPHAASVQYESFGPIP
jgi:hypothetical protein